MGQPTGQAGQRRRCPGRDGCAATTAQPSRRRPGGPHPEGRGMDALSATNRGSARVAIPSCVPAPSVAGRLSSSGYGKPGGGAAVTTVTSVTSRSETLGDGARTGFGNPVVTLVTLVTARRAAAFA